MENYKEKYEKALSYVKDLIEHNVVSQENAGKYFSELAESEDEKIRKNIIELIKQSSSILSKQNQEQMISWVEKQKEAKLTEEEIDGIFKQGQQSVVDNPEKYVLQKKCEWSEDEKIRITLIKCTEDLSDKWIKLHGDVSKENIISWLEKQKHDGKKWIYEDQYLKDLDRLYEDGKDEVLNNLEKYGLQKPAEWNDEDEKMMNDVLDSLACYKADMVAKEYDATVEILDNEIEWLKSLKDRVQPQPKQEWSEEDKIIRNGLIYRLSQDKELHGKEIAWLKSLNPQPHWKPSGQQIDALQINLDTYWLIERDILKQLLDELKTL